MTLVRPWSVSALPLRKRSTWKERGEPVASSNCRTARVGAACLTSRTRGSTSAPGERLAPTPDVQGWGPLVLEGGARD